MATRAATRNPRRTAPIDVSLAAPRGRPPAETNRVRGATRSCAGAAMPENRITCRALLASGDFRGRGVLAFATVTLDGALELDGITVRATRGGEPRVVFPHRASRTGIKHPFVRVIDAALRERITQAVLEAYAACEGGRAA
ncbi:MAG: hypothetical protein EPO68_13795 [Planctomycetota bacterium]|nr:MAG: hypothetical protein EPO68_13795 [Planctomycetota bacterium]